MKLKNLIPLIPAGLILVASMFSHSCANTTTPPTGGPKDTIPPRLVAVSPAPGALNVPVHKTKLSFKFNEYVLIKEGKNIYLSPPLSKPPKYHLNDKKLIVTFEEDLAPNTTYNLDISGAIVDNNENNPFPGYILTFSTGERIDSMYITGIVQDSKTLHAVPSATVLLYKDQSDSAIFKHRPDASTKTDEWGYFTLRNIQDTVFRLYAILDEGGNNIYDPEVDQVAFLDTLIHPTKKVGPKIYELFKFDMKDTASCMRRKADYELNLFKAANSKQMITGRGRPGERTMYLKFMSPNVQIKSLKIKEVPPKRLLTHFNAEKDSLILWVNDTRNMPDTFHMTIKYMKTDSTGILKETEEKYRLGKPKDSKFKSMRSSKKNLKHEDTIAVFKIDASPERFEQYGVVVSFEYPLVRQAFDSLKYEVVNARQKVSKGKYTWERDSTDIRTYIIRHQGKILPGYQYKLTVPYRKFKDINSHWNDSLAVTIKLPDDDKLSTLNLEVKGIVKGNHYIVDLMNEKRDKIIRGFNIQEDCTLLFPYLKAGKYCVRITEDRNHNNMVDTGDLLEHRQPEKVRFYKLKDGSFMLDIPASSELTQTVPIDKIFK